LHDSFDEETMLHTGVPLMILT